jgi:NAD(P) transhydrogenase
VAPTYDYDFVAIGSGPAGQRGAVQAAKLGRRVALVERRRLMGGVCVDTGTIPSKTFREAVVSFVATSRPFGSPAGAAAVHRPTAAQLLARVAQVVSLECKVIENQLRRNDVEVLSGTASFRDPHTLLIRNDAGSREITAASILVAVGTQPVPPPGVAHDGDAVFTSDDIVRLKRLPRTLTVVGAGVIGTEYASMFAELGVQVTLIEKRPRPLEFLDAEIVDELIHQMRERNVTFRPNEAVERVDVAPGETPRVTVTLDSGKKIVSEAVLFSVGRTGATAELDLAAAGLAADERGRLAVDAEYRTAVPNIFAAGDVIGYPSLAATSSEQGRLAACVAMGVAAGRVADHFPIGIYAIPEISMAGATEEQLTRDRVPYETGIARYREIARGQILGDESGLFKMLFHREDRRLLGVHIIGTGATELVHIGQAVLGLGGGLDYFLGTVFNYPTLAECYKVAALNAANKLAS